MILHDLFDWSNSGVGVAGLALTVGAIWQATGAKKAAQDARHAVYRRNASDDLRRLERLATGLLTAIETEEYDLASHEARDLISECVNVREHHRARFGMYGGKLDVAFVLLRSISRGIHTGVERDTLIDAAQRLLGGISSLAGAMSRQSEEDGQ
jgi:hypothetical protein